MALGNPMAEQNKSNPAAETGLLDTKNSDKAVAATV